MEYGRTYPRETHPPTMADIRIASNEVLQEWSQLGDTDTQTRAKYELNLRTGQGMADSYSEDVMNGVEDGAH